MKADWRIWPAKLFRLTTLWLVKGYRGIIRDESVLFLHLYSTCRGRRGRQDEICKRCHRCRLVSYIAIDLTSTIQYQPFLYICERIREPSCHQSVITFACVELSLLFYISIYFCLGQVSSARNKSRAEGRLGCTILSTLAKEVQVWGQSTVMSSGRFHALIPWIRVYFRW